MFAFGYWALNWAKVQNGKTLQKAPAALVCHTTVESVSVMRDMATGRARGFAFVEMGSDEDAQNAISQFNNYSLGGRNLTVNEARPKPQSSGGYGGGGGGGKGGRRREPRW